MPRLLFIIFTFIILNSTFSIASAATPPAPIPQTGQTISYAAGDDGALRNGVVWPNPRFNDNGNGTATDNLTGLMWTKDGKMPGPAACDPVVPKPWDAAMDYAVCLNTNSYLGYTDWRVPSIRELGGLVDASQFSPALPSGHPFVNGNFDYWSSTTDTGTFGVSIAWTVRMDSGVVSLSSKIPNLNYVWPVRDAQLTYKPAPTPKTGQTISYAAGDDGALRNGVVWPLSLIHI